MTASVARLTRVGYFGFFALVAAAACGGLRGTAEGTGTAPRAERAEAFSNVARADYAGASVCAGCHSEIAATHATASMHDMTRDAKTARIQAPFDGAVFTLKEDTATFTQRDGERVLSLASALFGRHDYRVTKVIGGRRREDFVGVELKPDGRVGDEEILPVSYVLDRKAFRYKGYSVMTEERPGLRAGPVWRETCVFCHNTVPALSTMLGVLVGEGAPPYQGSTVDRFLPRDRQLQVRVGSPNALMAALDGELATLRSRPGESPSQAAARSRDDFHEPATLLATTLR